MTWQRPKATIRDRRIQSTSHIKKKKPPTNQQNWKPLTGHKQPSTNASLNQFDQCYREIKKRRSQTKSSWRPYYSSISQFELADHQFYAFWALFSWWTLFRDTDVGSLCQSKNLWWIRPVKWEISSGIKCRVSVGGRWYMKLSCPARRYPGVSLRFYDTVLLEETF